MTDPQPRDVIEAAVNEGLRSHHWQHRPSIGQRVTIGSDHAYAGRSGIVTSHFTGNPAIEKVTVRLDGGGRCDVFAEDWASLTAAESGSYEHPEVTP